ncbi:MAG TPA: HEAT repeat domain-containing protein [Miltoncostaeaceae bacterium]|nr:HEAT repeat domain-containing protein [Miltoncostaeaceae bacterium]
MSRRDELRAALRPLPRPEWPAWLTARSGLPGPRGNLELVDAVADEGDRDMFDGLIATGDEYLVVCGVVGLGRLLGEGDDPALRAALHEHARDGRWRVREAAAMALQRLGDADAPRLRALVAAWAADPDPLVQRAAVAGICEPRLLRDPAAAAAARDACAVATGSLAARPAAERRLPDVRTLRQALGYCWSVAVAADPDGGLPRFLALAAEQDPDIAWIVRENRRKARLARLLPAGL